MINLDDLTLGQAKDLLVMFARTIKHTDENQNVEKNDYHEKIANRIIGYFVIARCYSAGVHAGTVVAVNGENVVLSNSVRLWSWKAKDGLALSGVAQFGIEKEKSKLDALNPVIYLTGVCELIPCTKAAKDSICEK